MKWLVLFLLIPSLCFGADKKLDKNIEFLKTRVEKFGSSDYFVDLWGDDDIMQTIKDSGLTNKHALYVDSHGLRTLTDFVIRPDERVFKPMLKYPPWYKIKDIAMVLGVETNNVHNVYFSACNSKDGFRAADVRKVFPNATNICHVPSGYKGNTKFFVEAITGYPKDDPKRICRPLWANLYLPNAKTPYKVIIANRSLLE